MIDFYAVGLVFVIVPIARGRLPSQSSGTAIAIAAIFSMAMLGSEFRRMREYGDVTRLPEVARQVREMSGKSFFADWYGSDFLPTLFANYELTSSLPPYFIYRRRQDHPR